MNRALPGRTFIRIISPIVSASVLSALLVLPRSSVTEQTANLRDLDAFITRVLKEYGVPGAAVSVVQDGKEEMGVFRRVKEKKAVP